MCTVLLPPDGYPIAVNKYIIPNIFPRHRVQNESGLHLAFYSMGAFPREKGSQVAEVTG